MSETGPRAEIEETQVTNEQRTVGQQILKLLTRHGRGVARANCMGLMMFMVVLTIANGSIVFTLAEVLQKNRAETFYTCAMEDLILEAGDIARGIHCSGSSLGPVVDENPGVPSYLFMRQDHCQEECQASTNASPVTRRNVANPEVSYVSLTKDVGVYGAKATEYCRLTRCRTKCWLGYQSSILRNGQIDTFNYEAADPKTHCET